MSKYTVRQLKEDLRSPYAWPGGYEIAFVTNDGEILCHTCARANFREIADSMTHGIDDGWRITGKMYEAVSAECAREVDPNLVSYCAHCNKEFGEFGA